MDKPKLKRSYYADDADYTGFRGFLFGSNPCKSVSSV